MKKLKQYGHLWMLPAASVALLGLAACGDTRDGGGVALEQETPEEVTASEFALRPFESCQDLNDHMADVVLETMLEARYGDGYGRGGVDDLEAAPNADADSGGQDAPDDYTGTNNQEEGVDEADLVKTDGTHIYVAQGDNLSIIKSWPAEETELVAQLELGGYASQLFIHEDRALVFSSIYNHEGVDLDGFEMRTYGGTRVSLVDISDREAPTLVREIDIEGYMVNGRMIDGQAYVVLNSYFNLPQEMWELLWSDDLELPQMDWDASPSAKEAIRDEARRILAPLVSRMVAQQPVDSWLPRVRDRVAGQQDARVDTLMGCDQVYRPANVSQFGMLNLMRVDMQDDQAPTASTGLLANGWQVYASQDNLYVALSSSWWWWGWGSWDVETHIHKFSLGQTPRYEASGAVDGWLLNQFSMSEYDGYLRVATTDFRNWWGPEEDSDQEPANNVFVLDQKQGALETVGQVRGIAPGEQIFAVRMMGQKGYVVTFEQTDPLFTIDLSDPYQPEVVGELHIPGFSNYLHPMGEDHLLAVGRAGDDDGNLRGVQVQIFDVSDFAHPALAHQFELDQEGDGWSWSEAQWDHHAFTFHNGVLSFPLAIYNYDEADGRYDYFSGLVVLDVDAQAGISEVGRVDHSDLALRQACPYQGDDRRYCDDFYDYNWNAQMRRSIYIEDNLYSLSQVGLKVSPLRSPESSMAEVMLVPER
jgi:uncharacterized secreted protein with C-terminal beta-propeller domain